MGEELIEDRKSRMNLAKKVIYHENIIPKYKSRK